MARSMTWIRLAGIAAASFGRPQCAEGVKAERPDRSTAVPFGRSAQVGSGQVGSGQVGAAEVGSGEVGPG